MTELRTVTADERRGDERVMVGLGAPARARTPLRSRVSAAILTTDPRRRSVLTMWATSFGTYVLYAALGLLQVALGLAYVTPVVILLIAMIIVNATFYTCFRAGVASTSTRDRDLGHTQLYIGIVFMWLTYALAGPASGATLIITASHIVYAAFNMPPKKVRMLVIASLTGLAVTMTVSWLIDPDRYPARVQLVSFGYTVIVLFLISRLANQITAMSDRLRAQRRDLAAALEKVHRLASSDDLTQAHNRRHMMELMHVERARVDRAQPLCIALIDIDLFKSINDRFGHAAGDEVLRRFARHAERVLRSTDLFARWGGEEFMAMFVGIAVGDAVAIVDRLRDQIAAADFGMPGLSVTFSAGLVQLCPDETLERAIERADQEMYRAKSTGRDRTCTPVTALQPQLDIFTT